MGAADRSLPISGCFAAISLIDVILVWRLYFPVFLNHGVDNTVAACAIARPCSKSTTLPQGFSATEPAFDQGVPQKYSLPENDAGYAPNPNR